VAFNRSRLASSGLHRVQLSFSLVFVGSLSKVFTSAGRKSVD